MKIDTILYSRYVMCPLLCVQILFLDLLMNCIYSFGLSFWFRSFFNSLLYFMIYLYYLTVIKASYLQFFKYDILQYILSFDISGKVVNYECKMYRLMKPGQGKTNLYIYWNEFISIFMIDSHLLKKKKYVKQFWDIPLNRNRYFLWFDTNNPL